MRFISLSVKVTLPVAGSSAKLANGSVGNFAVAAALCDAGWGAIAPVGAGDHDLYSFLPARPCGQCQ